jgi:Domain of unknown function (DUF1902)
MSRIPLTSISYRLMYDREANVWLIADSTILGLSGEADTLEALLNRLSGLTADLLEENGLVGAGRSEACEAEQLGSIPGASTNFSI